MMGLVLGLSAAVIVLVFVIAFLAAEIGELRRDVSQDERADHAKCIAHIADVTSKRVVALALRDLARRYESPEEVRTIQQIKRTVWKPEGPVLPVLWLLHHADELDPPTDQPAAEHTLSGERVL